MSVMFAGLRHGPEQDHGDLSFGAHCAMLVDVAADSLDTADGATQAAALYHARLIAALADGDVLPIRFGAVFSGRQAVAEFLKVRGDALVSVLSRLSGLREFTVTLSALPAARSQQDPVNGREWLAKRARARQDQGLRTQLERHYAGEVTNYLQGVCQKAAPLPRRADILRLACLSSAPPNLSDSLRISLAEQGMALSCDGPWPTYSFAHEMDAS